MLGFVRNYARVVGLDEADLSALVRSELDAGAPRPAPRVEHQYDVDDPSKTPSRSVTWLALALFLAVLLAVGVFWRSYYAPATDLPSLAQPDPAPVGAAAPAKPAANPAPVASGPVVFTAREDGVWVKFYDGRGQQLMQKQLAMGESYTVPADAVEPKLWTGRPDALTITIGGQAVPPLSDHRGIVRDVPVPAKALLARAQPAAASAVGAVPAGNVPTGALGRAGRSSSHRTHRGASVEAPAASPTPDSPAPTPVAAPAAAATSGAAQ